MDEENKEESKDAVETKDDGDKYETTPVIERARQEREKMESATEAQKKENDRTEQIMARKVLGGVTEAGQGDNLTPKEKETAKAQKVADEITTAFN